MRTRYQVLSCLVGLVWLGLTNRLASGQGQLLLKSGFEGQVRVTQNMSDITGIDPNSGFDWGATPEWIESCRFVYHSMAWNRAGPISQWYDDLELWSGLPLGHPALDEDDSSKEVIFEEHFDHPDGSLPRGWWSEGDAADIRNGRLHVNADTGRFRQSTIWLDRAFSGNLRVEYDVCVLASTDVADNVNFFLLYSDPSGKPLHESRQARADGRYTRYHSLNGYIFTNVADGNEVPARIRFRDCPGFHLVAENRQYEMKRGKVYHITVEKRGHHFTHTVDGHTLLDTVDDRFNPPHRTGLMGFRTWHTELWWDNLIVTRL